MLKSFIGKFVVVRTVTAGVHTGTLEHLEDKTAVLSEARRVWRWNEANTLNELANKGCCMDYSRISEPTAYIILTEAIEIIDATGAKENLTLSRWPA